MYVECAKRLLASSENKRKSALDIWRNRMNEMKKIEEIQKRFLSRLLMSKAGRVA